MIATSRRFLFITWDGPSTSYLEGLFLPIFVELKAAGFAPHVLQFSWGARSIHERRAALCESAGIPYRHVAVWRRTGGAGAFLSASFGARHIRRAVRDWQIDTLMPRSLMPALAVLRLRWAERKKLSLVFDADGLAADERVDFGGLSPHSLTYRVLRDIEAEMLRQADSVLCRTEAAKNILIARAGAGVKPETYHVVPNGKDPKPFVQALSKRKIERTGVFRLCYCGSIGEQYRLPETLDIASFLKQSIPNLTFQVISPDTRSIHAEIERSSLNCKDWISVLALSPDNIPAALSTCDLGLALRRTSFSMQAVQPIKIGEYLLAGLPVIGTPSVGSTSRLISDGVFRSGEKDDREQTLRWILEQVIPRRGQMRELCHEIGKRDFSVAETASQYAAALQYFPGS